METSSALSNTSERGFNFSPVKPRTVTRYFRLDLPEEGADVRNVLLGVVLPAITILVLLINILMLTVFYKGKFSNSTHLILIAISIADSLNGLFFLIPSMHFFTFNNNQDFVTYDWCLAYFILQLISRVSHGASLFYTVFLAAHRYICVRFPFKARILCIRKYTFVAISVIPIMSFLVHILLIVRMSKLYGAYTTSLLQENKTIHACVEGDFIDSTTVRIWIPDLFTKIFPISTLIVLSVLLIKELKFAAKNIQHFAPVQRHKVQRRREINLRITILTVAVVCCVLLTEIPGFVVHIVIRNSSAFSCTKCALMLLVVINQLTTTIFFPVNFLIYCLVISKFRKTLFSIVYTMSSCCRLKFSFDLTKSASTTKASGKDKKDKRSSTQRTGLSE